MKKGLSVEDEEQTSNFTDSEASLNIYLVVSMIPIEHDVISEVTEDEEDFIKEMTAHQPKCYYVMDNGCVEGQQAMFERPDHHMQHHLKPLAKINDVGINKVLVDGGAAGNLLRHCLLKKIGLSKTDLKPHNVVQNRTNQIEKPQTESTQTKTAKNCILFRMCVFISLSYFSVFIYCTVYMHMTCYLNLSFKKKKMIPKPYKRASRVGH